MRYALLVVGMLLAWTAPVFAAVVTTVHDASYRAVLVDEPPSVRVDWPRQTVFIITQAKAPANAMGRRAYKLALSDAIAQARQKVCTDLSALKLTSYATAKEAAYAHVLPEDSVMEVSNAVRPVVDRWDASQRTLTLLCALPMLGSSSAGELAARMLKVEQLNLAQQINLPVRPKESMNLRMHENVTQISAGPYTGLILDCRGLHYVPALLPKFVAEDGTEFWGTAKINRLLVMEKGIAQYTTNFRDALNSSRIGETPLIVRPLGTTGKLYADLVFRADDVKLIQEQDALAHFLEPLNVVIVID